MTQIDFHKKLNKLKIKQILNEIGDPEDIFELEESEDKSGIINIAKSLINTGKTTVKKIFATGVNIGNLILLIKTIFINIIKLGKTIVINIFKIAQSIIINSLKYLKKVIVKLFKLAEILISNLFIIFKKIFNLVGSFIGYIILFCSILMLFFIPVITRKL